MTTIYPKWPKSLWDNEILTLESRISASWGEDFASPYVLDASSNRYLTVGRWESYSFRDLFWGEKMVKNQRPLTGKHRDDPAIPLLETAIIASGLGVTRYATSFLFRSPSTVHKWRRGETPIPSHVKRMLSPQPLLDAEPPPPGDDE